VNVASRRCSISDGRAGADGVIIRAKNVRETERIQIFLEIPEAGIIGIVPGGIHHLRMMGVDGSNNVVEILDVRGGVGRGFIPDAVPVRGGEDP
jgi:hypothetical protein